MKKILNICALFCPLPDVPVNNESATIAFLKQSLKEIDENSTVPVLHFVTSIRNLVSLEKEDEETWHTARSLLEKKRLAIGPFYLLALASIYGAETFVRNLLLGNKLAQPLTEIQKVAFLPAVYGLNSQLPQILMGFNIDALVLPDKRLAGAPSSPIFNWESPDGSRILLCSYTESGKAEKLNVQSNAQPDYCLYLILVTAKSGSYAKLIEETYQKLAMLPECEIKKTSLIDYVWSIKEMLKPRETQSFKGELCGLQAAQSIMNEIEYCLRHDLTLRQYLHQAEMALQFLVEPWAMVAYSLGKNDSRDQIPSFWQNLIELQAFCLSPTVKFRSWQSQVATALTAFIQSLQNNYRACINYFLDNIKFPAPHSHHSYWTIFNPHPTNRTEIIEAALELPEFLNRDTVVMREVEGREIPLRILDKLEPINFGQNERKPKTALYRCLIELHNVPALGWKTYQMNYHGVPKSLSAVPISAEHNALENDFLRVGINSNGTLEIFAKETGAFWTELGYFMDEADLGPQAIPGHSSHVTMTTKNLIPTIKLLYNNALGAAYRLEYIWDLPRDFNWQSGRRSVKHEKVRIIETLSLNRLSKYLEVDLEIDSQIHDHRLQMCFPLDFQPDICVTDGFYNIERRSLKDTERTRCTTLGMGNFVGFSNEDGGIAFLCQGLGEFNFYRTKPNIVGLLLLRDYKGYSEEIKASFGEQKRIYRLAIMPHLGNWENSGVLNEITKFIIPLEIHPIHDNNGNLPLHLQFLKVTPESIVYSALKPAEYDNGVVLRLFNPTSNLIESEVVTYLPIKSLSLLSLEEKIISSLEPEDNFHFSVRLFPKKIVTVKINFQQEK